MPRCLRCPTCKTETFYHRGGFCVRCYGRHHYKKKQEALGLKVWARKGSRKTRITASRSRGSIPPPGTVK